MKSLTEKGAAAEDGRVHVGEFSQVAIISVSILLLFYYITRRVPVQRAVERDEIPYPFKVHDTTLHPLLNITIK